MTWIFIAILAYFLLAIANIVDKYVLKNTIKDPVVYVVLVSLLGGLGVLLFPFGFYFPGWSLFLFILLSGVAFTFALLCFYYSLTKNEASRILPFIGGLQPIFVFWISYAFLGERLNNHQLGAFIILLMGSIIISLDFSGKKKIVHNIGFVWAFFAALLFAVSFTSIKHVYDNHAFISAFVWSRIVVFGVGLLILMNPAVLRLIKKNLKKSDALPKRKASIKTIIIGQSSGALATVLIQLAISLGSVAIINAMQGLEYFFIFIFALLLTIYRPKLLKEKITQAVIIQKVGAILVIFAGLGLLAYASNL